MKGKYLFGGLFMALLGASIALFAYTKIVDKPLVVSSGDSSSVESRNADLFLTSLQSQEGQIDFTFAAEATVHAVVHVHTTSTRGVQSDNPIMEYFYGNRSPRQREVQGYGSGVIATSNGYIITNNHVIEDAQTIEVTLNDNRTFKAELVGSDPSSDIALLKIDADKLPFIRFGDSDQLKLGEWVLAVGNPFNLTSTVTAGIVSAKGRNLGLNTGDYRIESFIQTDAALNMGNSGGALVNTKGLLVGITSAILSPSGAYAGNSFAIPVSIVKKVFDDLKEFGEVQRALIGVNILNVDSDVAEEQNLSEVRGILVTGIVPDGSAEEAGMKINDVIVKFDGITVNTVSELQEQVGKHRPGDKANITYIRNGKEISVPIVLRNRIGNTDIVTADMGTEEVFGSRVEALGPSDKRSMRIDSGVKILEVDNGKFSDLGLRRGYIILSINGKKVNSPADIRQATNDEKTLKSIRGIQPDGTIFSYEFGN
jgi:serine protease Do